MYLRAPLARLHPVRTLVAAAMLASTLIGTTQQPAIQSRSGPAAEQPARAGKSSAAAPVIRWTLTRGDERAQLTRQRNLKPRRARSAFGTRPRAGDLGIDMSRRGQEFVGVGAALTESSAVLLSSLPKPARAQVLEDLFHPTRGAGISLLRVPLGASDFALADYTYNDLPAGSTDPQLRNFSMQRDFTHVLPVLAEATRINPDLQVMLTPWSAPAWMKSSGSTHGGKLLSRWESVYAEYLARSAAGFHQNGIRVAALSVANEPGYATADYPSMWLGTAQQVRLGILTRKALDSRGLHEVDLLALDHNWSDADTALRIVSQAGGAYAGAAFHCYDGDVSAQAKIPPATAGVWTTECSGGDWATSYPDNLAWGATNMLIGALRNGSSAVMWWNIALDPDHGPRNGGCQDCRGVITVDPTTGQVTHNVEYHLLAHAGRFIPRGSVRVGSAARARSGVDSVAFHTPDDRIVLLALNPAGTTRRILIRHNGREVRQAIPARSLATFSWPR